MSVLINPLELITPNRIDLISKYKYVEIYDKKQNLKFITDYYLKVIEAFSDGKFIEEDGTNRKQSAEDFLRYFNELIESMKKNGYIDTEDFIPVTPEGDIDNGAHRTAIAAYYGIKVPTRCVSNSICFNYEYFKNKMLDEDVLDYLALEYSKLKKNSYIACFWPKADLKSHSEAIDILKQHGGIIYKKEIKISLEALIRFISQIYSHQSWVGTPENHFRGAVDKAKRCYVQGNKLTIVLFESTSLETVIEQKTKIREIFDEGNHSIHITDNQNETIDIGNIVFNKNSRDLIFNGDFERYKNIFYDVQNFKKRIKKSEFSLDDFIIDSSSVMALYGLRETNDIDFLSDVFDTSTIENNIIDNHSEYLTYYGKTLEELLHDPNNYLYYFNVKFISLNVLKEFKNNRAEKKDMADVCLIEEFQRNADTFQIKILRLRGTMRKRIRNMQIFFIQMIKSILVRMGIFEFVKSCLKKR